jgi:murein DD-endopeptidase MepM/ murein hydrolase activator NlpD
VDWVSQDLSALGKEINSRERSLRELKAFIEEKASVLAATPTILPVKGLVTAGYGYRRSPFTGQRELHEGLDIAAPYGSPIVATADGIVTFAGPLAGYGNTVFVDHGHGLSTFYGHCSSYRVREAQRVRRGEVIAFVGTTGRTTGTPRSLRGARERRHLQSDEVHGGHVGYPLRRGCRDRERGRVLTGC